MHTFDINAGNRQAISTHYLQREHKEVIVRLTINAVQGVCPAYAKGIVIGTTVPIYDLPKVRHVRLEQLLG